MSPSHCAIYKYRVEVQILSILFNSSIDFDKDQDFFAVGGVTRQLKVYEYNSVVTRPVSVHYPVQDMGCGSKIRYALYRIDIDNYEINVLTKIGEAFSHKHHITMLCIFINCDWSVPT